MENLKVRELIEICEELGLTLGRAKRKQAILEIMKKEGVTAEEVDEAWADIKGRREEAERREIREREEAERRELREREREEAERQERLEMKRIELALRQCSQAPSVASATVPVSGHRIRDQLPPFVVGEDMAKYLVKFEHVCERNAIERSLWAQNLLALLPGELSSRPDRGLNAWLRLRLRSGSKLASAAWCARNDLGKSHDGVGYEASAIWWEWDPFRLGICMKTRDLGARSFPLTRSRRIRWTPLGPASSWPFRGAAVRFSPNLGLVRLDSMTPALDSTTRPRPVGQFRKWNALLEAFQESR
ncbi:hypothetical protein HPB50_025687 [Hyalomma asiaticum]|uniref:Uncharacterized protein n=1 Tax=Hyalomma asiaticum TaxID=266040 RepID=A0ACB7T6P7_HYAAI|nr:hypothetical protein HPB50_025687 [Hyalomma asiaticum]